MIHCWYIVVVYLVMLICMLHLVLSQFEHNSIEETFYSSLMVHYGESY